MLGRSIRLTTVRGIPIRAHITLLVLLPVVLLNLPPSQWGWGLLGMVGLFASVALHELGHSLVALRRHYRVLDITLLPIGGLARMDRAPERPGDEFAIALAGPGVSLALAALLRMLALPLSRGPVPVLGQLAGILAGTNLLLALFNLLPSFPMDGGRVFRAWLTPFIGRLEATRRAAKLGRTLAVAFGLWSLFFRFNLFNLAIAVFVYLAAGAEYRSVVVQESRKRGFGGPDRDGHSHVLSENDTGVYVSPPPYAQRRADAKRGLLERIRSLFDDLARRP